MKVSFASLLNFLPSLSKSPIEVAEIFTNLGIEVEHIEESKPKFSHVKVAEVTEIKPHPDASALKIATVFDGTSHYTVVCGAPNCQKGLKVAFAPVGACVLDKSGSSITLEKASLRGVDSEGMLTSEKELGLSEDHAGIWELHPDEKLGSDIASFFSGPILDISLTPNLAHCQSAFGLACELAAALDITKPELRSKAPDTKTPPFAIEIQDNVLSQGLCTRYSLGYFSKVNSIASPLWLRSKLHGYGVRSAGVIVDVINAAMFDYGLPMHGFDANSLEGKKLKIGTLTDQQTANTLTTLDGKKRTLEPQDLIISDNAHPIALAGVMGGQNSEVKKTSTSLVVEAAIFNKTCVRKTAKRLGLRTEAAMRYERGCDPEMTLFCLAYVSELLHKAKATSSPIQIADSYPQKVPLCELTLNTDRVNALLGTTLSLSEIKQMLERLSFTCNSVDSEEQLDVKVPSSRMHDVKAPIDLIEEVARLYGLQNLKTIEPLSASSPVPNHPLFDFSRKTRRAFIESGLEEFMTCNLISEEMLEPWKGCFNPSTFARVTNASIVQYSFLRPSLIPGLMQSLCYNLKRQESRLSAFEIGFVHMKEKEGYIEPLMAAAVLTGNASAPYFQETNTKFSFLDLKGVLEGVLEKLGLKDTSFVASHMPAFHTFQQAEIHVDGCVLGQIGRCHPLIEKALGISEPVYIAEINLNDALSFSNSTSIIQEISPYPSTKRDWTVCAGVNLPFEKLKSACKSASCDLLQDIELISIYSGSSDDPQKHHVTLRFTYQRKQSTLTFDEAQKAHETMRLTVLDELKGFLFA